MLHFFKIFSFAVVLSYMPLFSALGGETGNMPPGQALQATPSSSGSQILEGKLLKIEGDFWVVEDKANHQHRIHIGSETMLPSPPKQLGDSIQALVKKDGHALLIQ